MKKTLRKISKAVIIVMLLLAMDLTLIQNCVQAADIGNEKVYGIDNCEEILRYKGIARGATYVVYENEGIQYPAYCLNPERIGVGEVESYNVDVSGYITDVKLWRIIINGYPYKSVEELGVANRKEAYLATKQAVYSYLENRDVNQYTGIGEAGQRTLNALKKIWNDAQNCTETKISNVIDVIPISEKWKQDELDPKYISKVYKTEAVAPIVSCDVDIIGENVPEGTITTDLNNRKNTVFNPFEKFKVMIPIDKLKNGGNFQIEVTTQMCTKPVLYGASPSSNLQNYALTTFTYEDAFGTYAEQYPKNESQIKITKREKETNAPIKGVEFEILDSKKEIVFQSLITNDKGEITLKSVRPGRYYLKEVRTLQGYVLYDELIQIDLNLNEQINIIVNNSKEKNIEISKEVTNIEVGKTEENISEDLKETNINKEKDEINVDKELNNTNINQETNKINVDKEINNSNINKETNEININKELNNTNINKGTNKIEINKENTSTNIDKTVNTINITEKINRTNIIQQENIQRLPKTGM